MERSYIAILDFGSQYTHLISRRIRQLGVYARIFPSDINAHELSHAIGMIISGGPNSVNDQTLPYDPGIFDLSIPILGLCYGHQLMAHHYGGLVKPGHDREYGKAVLEVKDHNDLFIMLEHHEQVWMSHGDSVVEMPEGFHTIGTTDDCRIAAMANSDTRRYGLQFHPEVHHTTHGMRMLENFIFEICDAETNWSMEEYLTDLEDDIRRQVGDKKVFLLVSGGVDSTVAFALLQKILGKDRVYGVHIDTGFLREQESLMVERSLQKAGFHHLHVVDASHKFLTALIDVTDPEEKRRIIGRMFIDVQKETFQKLGFNADEWLLGQGTIYPDTIESGGTKASDRIKTHHNRVDEILELINQGKVVEPLVDLYKDEVRDIGRTLGLSETMLMRWPFPGPGLAIRCLCHNTSPSFVSDVDMQERLSELAADIGYTATVMSVRSVGVQGDQRSYKHPVLLHGLTEVTWDVVHDVGVRITNSVRGVNRVVLHVGGIIDIANMVIQRAFLTKDRLAMLRKADVIVDEVIHAYHLENTIWQFPVVLLPITFGAGETIVLRPIESEEAMTVNFYKMDKDVLHEMVNRILEISGVGTVLYDITNKPPATIEWE